VPSFKTLDFTLHPLPSAAVSAALPRGHVALALVDLGVGFADRAAVVVEVGFSQDLQVLHISICTTPETISTFDPLVTFLILSFLDILEDLLKASISVASTRLLLFSVSLHVSDP